jgi:superfamily II DNA or RNA helicase
VARLHLLTERFLTEVDGVEEEVELPALRVTFDYSGTELRASDQRHRFFAAVGEAVQEVERDRIEEKRVQCLIESFGAVEVEQASAFTAPLDSPVDYILQPDGNVHSWCSFSVHGVEQLRSAGCQVTVAGDFPYQVVEDDPPWVAAIEPDPEKLDWFGLSLGILVENERVDVLPTLLELLEKHPDGKSLDSFLSVPSMRVALAVGRRRYVTLPPERLRALLRVLLELYRGDRLMNGKLRFAGVQANGLVHLQQALQRGTSELIFEGARDVLHRGRRLGKINEQGVANAYLTELTTALRPYQREGLDWLQKLRTLHAGGVLADDMGLGKTLQTIAHLCVEKSQGRMDRPSLVVVPTSLCANWSREITRFAPDLRHSVIHGKGRMTATRQLDQADVVITSYPILLRDIELFRAQLFHLVILDEAQAIKNYRSQIAHAVKQIEARFRLCLSGTPVENNLDELWSLFSFVMPELLGDLKGYRTRFRNPIERSGDRLRLQALKERVAPFVLRRMKEQVARELPPKTEIVRPVELDGDQRDLYECIRLAVHAQVRQAILAKGLAQSSVTVLDALLKLRQVCCDPQLVRMPVARDVKTSRKLEAFLTLVELQLQQGRRILVFSQFAHLLALLSEQLLKCGVTHTTLTGKTLDRQRRVDAFQNGDFDVFLISLKAGGTGLNLTRADTVIHYDPWWNGAAQSQATDRAHRIGQTRPVFVYNLIAAGSVEERMLALQQRKRQLAQSLFGGSEVSTLLNLSVIEDLFAPLDG